MKQLLLTGIAIIALALSGCAESGDSAPEGTQDTATQDPTDDAGEGSETQTTTQQEADAANTPPTAQLTADVLNGTAPLAVNFTIEGSDADGDNLTWELTLNGTALANGTQLPGQANATFEAAGNHTVVLTVADGHNETTATLTIVVEEPAPAEEEDPDAPEDRGWYIYDPVTGLCHAKDYDEYGGTIYVSELSGGTWVLAETNGVPGLQVEDNHPASGQGAGFELDLPDCVDGDLVVI